MRGRKSDIKIIELQPKTIRACPVFLRKLTAGQFDAFILGGGWTSESDMFKVNTSNDWHITKDELVYQTWVPISNDGGILPEDMKEATGVLLKVYTEKNGNERIKDVIEALSELLRPADDVSTR